MKKIVALAVMLVCGFTVTKANEYQYWLTLNTSSFDVTETMKTKSHGEFRFPNAERWSYFRLSQKLNWKLKKWTIGTHPTIEGSRSRGLMIGKTLIESIWN